MSGSVTHLVILLITSWLYLTLVRCIDVNEREPVWSLTVAYLLGGGAASLLAYVADPVSLVLQPWLGAAAEEVAKAGAYVVTLLVFAGVARTRGWFELGDLVDGIVYGIVIGLGFGAVDAFHQEIVAGELAGSQALSIGAVLVNGALGGLRHGLFGGITGLGIGLAVEAHGRGRRLLLALVGLGAAIGLNGAFRIVAHGNGYDAASTAFRAWLIVGLAIFGLAAVWLVGLARERRVIARQLEPEVTSGLLKAEDLALLENFVGRQLAYVRLLLAGRVHDCLRMAGRHNRLVQLALLKARLQDDPASRHGANLGRQVAALRRAIVAAAPMVLILFLTALTLQTQPNETVTRVLGIATPSLDNYWKTRVANYSTPKVGPFVSWSFLCPNQPGNAALCLGDMNIYYDPAFLNELADSIGDIAPVVVLAHEWGHKVQYLRDDAGTRAMWTISRELQADCYAGEWIRDVEKGNSGKLEKGDMGEALETLNRGRDPRGSPWYNPQAHGTGGQRVDAFQVGREGIPCTSDSLWIAVHIDPMTLPQRAAPPKGSLLAETARRRGRFVLVDIHTTTNLLTLNRPEAILATYHAPDGTEVQMIRTSYTNETGSTADFSADSTTYAGRGYTVRKQGDIKDGEVVVGRWVHMIGDQETVLLRNKQTYTRIIGPVGPTWELASAPLQ